MQHKNVIIDIRKIQNLNSGLGQYCLHLSQNLFKYHDEEILLSFWGAENNYFLKNVKYHQLFVNKIWCNKFLKTDVWHAIHQEADLCMAPKKSKLILTVHDLNFLQKYSGWKAKMHLKSLEKKINRADIVVAISNYTKAEMVNNLGLNDKQIVVIHNGANVIKGQSPQNIKNLEGKKFIFNIGIVQPKKNIHVLLPLLIEDRDLHLVVAGDNSSSYTNYVLKKAEEMKVLNRLHLIGRISEGQKCWLYENCFAFAFPSLAEGFGMPVIEALSFGKPVFLSNMCSLPEIAGDAAFYWNDFMHDSMNFVFKKGIESFYSDSSAAEKAILQSKRYDWEHTAKSYLDLYEKA